MDNVSRGILINDHETEITFKVSPDEEDNVPKVAFILFASDDGQVTGDGYKEYLLMRLDGEYCPSNEYANNELTVDRSRFAGWNQWKELNRDEFDCKVTFSLEGNTVISTADNGGISISCCTVFKTKAAKLYVALTGDQCAITNIRCS
ncbi:hypothetical protein SAMN02910456_00595 [Ruminococcaceae bacterium YRB3002]|nr:hypothetical protein SAMN02910456_00595 [Ruminococcaceae bacterium YRB3002]